jgi:DNA repair protein RadC
MKKRPETRYNSIAFMEQKVIIPEKSISGLKDSSLLSLVLSSSKVRYYSLEQANAIIQACENSLNRLCAYSLNDLQQNCGVPLSDGVKLKAAFELARRRQVSEILDKPRITNSQEVFRLFDHLVESHYEQFWILILNRGNRVIDRVKISEGGLTGTVVDPKKVYKLALDLYATSLILIHNHPSGNLSPSEADLAVTTKLINAGKFLDIDVLDHIIIGCGEYYSFADNGNI